MEGGKVVLASVIVPTLGRTDSLKRTIDSIERCSNGVSVELIVVGEDEGIPAGKSYSESMNKGLREASGDYLTIPGIANDIEVLPGWLDSMVRFLKKHPDVGMGVFKVLRPNYTLESMGGFVLPERYNGKPVACDYAGYGLVPRHVFEKVGFMDETFSPIYCEDCDYGLRVNQAGYIVMPCPQAQIIHHHSMENRKQPNPENRLYLLKKHQEWLRQR